MQSRVLADRCTNVTTPAVQKEGEVGPVLEETRDTAMEVDDEAKEALYNGSSEDMDDLMAMFQQLVVDPTIPETEKQAKLASLCDLGAEASRELRRVRLERCGSSDASASVPSTPPQEAALQAATPSPSPSPQASGSQGWWGSLVRTLSFGVPTASADDYAKAHF